ncbi:arsenate reductase family protein [Moraxella sp. Tifton1]|uniref:arsenate reductase family protein n=1 Tax=Moraxella oculi TaxID=2940516 RepID=UPI002011AC32|nr:arsenate reductase family protein [Moraxella sp. Tifton1]MCL1623639.1 arsenate reductase family protein [Moraxella sp. Tifton1]
MMLIIYGIKNCNTMKKAMDFLHEKGVVFDFFDYKKSTLSQVDFEQFITIFGEKVINKQGLTYRKFDNQTKEVLASDDGDAIYDIIKNNQSVLKRPILLGSFNDKKVALIGFDKNQWRLLM